MGMLFILCWQIDFFPPSGVTRIEKTEAKIAAEFFIHRTSALGIKFTLGLITEKWGTSSSKGSVSLREHTVQEPSVSGLEMLLTVYVMGFEIMKIAKIPVKLRCGIQKLGRNVCQRKPFNVQLILSSLVSLRGNSGLTMKKQHCDK